MMVWRTASAVSFIVRMRSVSPSSITVFPPGLSERIGSLHRDFSELAVVVEVCHHVDPFLRRAVAREDRKECRVEDPVRVVREQLAPDPDDIDMGDLGYGTTRINGAGQFVPSVAVLRSMVPRKEARHLLEVLKTKYPDVHFTIEDVSTMSEREIYFGTRNRKGILGFIGYS